MSNCEENDLIDLHVITPIAVSASSDHPECPSDNLLDSELPELEHKLQTSSYMSTPIISRRGSTVDIEDILISIEDDVVDAPPIKIAPMQRSCSAELLNIDIFCDNLGRSLSCDDVEALRVLDSLDEILNAELTQSDRTFNGNNVKCCLDERTHQSVEDCLMDLDNYLKELDSSYEDFNSSSADRNDTQSSQEYSDPDDVISLETNDCSLKSMRTKLRKIEENYAKFVASGMVNRGYVDTENVKIESRSLSACCKLSHALRKHRPTRATVSDSRRVRPRILNLDETSVRKSVRTADDVIDWNHQQDVHTERRAHASADCCTGTVVVEPLRRLPSRSSISLETVAMNEIPKSDARGGASTWLRTSMRRLRHFKLPIGTVPGATVPIETVIDIPQIASVQSERPVSAPSRLPDIDPIDEVRRSGARVSRRSFVSHEPEGRARSSSDSSRSRRQRSLSSSESSLASSGESTASCTPVTSPDHNSQDQTTANNARRPCERNRQHDMPDSESPLGQWPHSLSSMMACLSCSLGLFNISRFAMMTVHFGANFIFQFFLLSLIFGLPLFSLQMCLGQQLGAGVIDMWRISPLFQGVGVSLLVAQALLGLYSIIGVSWMFVFFRDSFISKSEKYRWAEPFTFYRDDIQVPVNGTYKLSQTIPDYFNGIVLQRHHLASGNEYGSIKFQLAFNLAVVWMIVFVSLSKGLRSYGKVIYVFTLLPVFGTFVLCAKILGMMPPLYINIIFPETSWNEFFLNPKSWLAAAQEVFLTWGLLGAAVMQITSHNKHKHLLQRDSSLVAVITFTILLLVAFLANTCVQILRADGYNYLPNSFENMNSYTFLRHSKEPLPPSLANTPVRYMTHNSHILGEKVVRPGVDYTTESGYQVLRLATELIPATFAVLGSERISPFWAVLFYFILILFGIAQQLAIWHCVITGIMAIRAKLLKSWETTITFCSCACGFLLGLPMATELGIYVVYFMDYTVGGVWWLMIIIILQIVAVFMIRGRPYSGDAVVTALFSANNHPCILSWAPALLSFTWNVILPVALVVLCITTFKNGNFREMFIWHHAPVAEYWPLWGRQIGSLLQLFPILCIPLVAVIQSYRYLNNGPSDILERIQLLYRPPIGEHMEDLSPEVVNSPNGQNANAAANATSDDPPPKYTPPPSYTTATGARLAKFLRQSIRRSVRRLASVLGESSNNARQRRPLPQTQPPPPDYNAVLVEMNQTPTSNTNDTTINVTDGAGIERTTPRHVRISTLERLRSLHPSPGTTIITAAEVASILRNSFRRSTLRRGNVVRRNNPTAEDNFDNDNSVASLSAENLVDSAAPIGETSLVLDSLPSSVNSNDNKSVTDMSTVI